MDDLQKAQEELRALKIETAEKQFLRRARQLTDADEMLVFALRGVAVMAAVSLLGFAALICRAGIQETRKGEPTWAADVNFGRIIRDRPPAGRKTTSPSV